MHEPPKINPWLLISAFFVFAYFLVLAIVRLVS